MRAIKWGMGGLVGALVLFALFGPGAGVTVFSWQGAMVTLIFVSWWGAAGYFGDREEKRRIAAEEAAGYFAEGEEKDQLAAIEEYERRRNG